MKLVCLAENTSHREGIGAEHGLSLYVETERHKLLFDMGQTELFAQNAEKLGIDLSRVELAVLSHGHYDHGGGLKRFLQLNEKAKIYLSPYAFGEHYHGEEKYIGLDKSLQGHPRLIFAKEEQSLGEGLRLFSCHRRPLVTPIPPSDLKVKRNGSLQPEDYLHEQYLLIEEKGKRILLSGCSHKGILNIVSWFEPDVLIGGFHLSKHPLDGELSSLAQRLSRFATSYCTCHCTGEAQFALMKKAMPKLFYLSAGDTVEC